MVNKYYRCVCFLISVLMVAGMLGACIKGEDSDTKASGNGTKTVTATATATKTAAKTTVKTNADSTVKSATSSASSAGNADSTAISAVTGDNYIENDEENQTDEPAEDDSDSGQAAEEKTYDLKGRVIKLIYQAVGQMPEPNSVDKTIDTRYKLMKEAEKKFNCTFEFEFINSWTTVQTKVEAAFMAGTYVADSFRYPISYALPSWEKMNLILPINDYIDYSQPKWKVSMNADGILYPENVYAIGQPGLTPIGLWYNFDILAREGIPDLRDYLKQGNWNWNTFLDVAINTTRDFNGDGVVDQWGVGAASRAYMGFGFLYSNRGVIIGRSEETGKFIYSLESSQSLKSLQLFSDLYNTYKVADTTGETKFVKGFVTMFVRELWYGGTLKGKGMNNIDFTYMPFGPDNPEGSQTVGAGSVHTYFFPVNLKNPEAVVSAVLYWLVPWDDSKSIYVTQNEMFTVAAGNAMCTKEGIDFYLSVATKPVSEFNLEYQRLFVPTETVVGTGVFDKVSTLSTTATSAIAAVKDQIQSIIDEKMAY